MASSVNDAGSGVCRDAHTSGRFPYPVRVALEPRLNRCGGGLDDKNLLFDRVVQIAREAGSLFLPGCGSELLLIGRAQTRSSPSLSR
jgi:hypothetical protein